MSVATPVELVKLVAMARWDMLPSQKAVKESASPPTRNVPLDIQLPALTAPCGVLLLTYIVMLPLESIVPTTMRGEFCTIVSIGLLLFRQNVNCLKEDDKYCPKNHEPGKPLSSSPAGAYEIARA